MLPFKRILAVFPDRRRLMARLASGLLCTALAIHFGCSAGSSKSADAALLQAMLGSGDLQVYFTDPRPGVSAHQRHAARDRLLELVAAANQQIEVWAYGLDEARLIDALLQAARRGVRLSIYGSPDQDYAELRASFARAGRTLPLRIRQRSGLQHVKLIIFDNRRAVTGTGNFTKSGLLYNHNAFLEIAIAPAFAAQWQLLRDRLQESAPSATNTDANARTGFRTDRPEDAPVLRLAPGVQAIVSPTHGRLIQSALLREVFAARSSLRFLIFSFTDPLLAAAFAVQARAGIALSGIVDDPANRGTVVPDSQTDRLNAALGLAAARIYLEGNRRVFALANGFFAGGHLHHKTLLVDEDTVLTGSYNWSLSARDRNLELLLMIRKRPVIAAAFRREFERIRAQARLLGRPPAFGAQHAASIAPGWSRADGLLCPPAQLATQHELLVFAGSGPYLRGLQFKPRDLESTAAGACYHLNDASPASSGIRTGRSAPALPGIGTSGARFAYAGLAMQGSSPPRAAAESESESPAAPLPCADPGECPALRMRAANLNAGWIWPASSGGDAVNPADAGFRAVQIWDRRGLGPRVALRESVANAGTASAQIWNWNLTQTNAPVQGDALLFFYEHENSRSARGIACVQHGAELDRQLREFLNLRYLQADASQPDVGPGIQNKSGVACVMGYED